jgi:hypothetical protein
MKASPFGSSLAVGLASIVVGCAGAEYRADEGHARLVAPVAIAEGHTGKPAVESTPAAAAQQQAADAPKTATGAGGTLPDPAGVSTTEHFRLRFRYDHGQLSLTSVQPVQTAKPVAPKRMMGRFALELWIGKELIERVRFDFPLLGAEPPPPVPANMRTPPRLAPGADVEREITVPGSKRATRAQLVDRGTGTVYAVSWPPTTAVLQAAPDPATDVADAPPPVQPPPDQPRSDP